MIVLLDSDICGYCGGFGVYYSTYADQSIELECPVCYIPSDQTPPEDVQAYCQFKM